jgi:hypothetical protein
MNEHDLTRNLTALADTMPDNVGRLAAVNRRTRRARQRRLAGRGAAATAAVALSVVGVAAVVRSPGGDGLVPASQPGTTSVPCPAPPSKKASADQGTTTAVKGSATVTAVLPGDMIEVAPTAPDTLPRTMTLTIVGTTTFLDGDQPAATRPALSVGETVAFAAEEVDGHMVLRLLEVNPPNRAVVAPSADANSTKPASEPRSGVVASVPGKGVVEVQHTGEDPSAARITLHTTDATVFKNVANLDGLKVGDTVEFDGSLSADGQATVSRIGLVSPASGAAPESAAGSAPSTSKAC